MAKICDTDRIPRSHHVKQRDAEKDDKDEYAICDKITIGAKQGNSNGSFPE